MIGEEHLKCSPGRMSRRRKSIRRIFDIPRRPTLSTLMRESNVKAKWLLGHLYLRNSIRMLLRLSGASRSMLSVTSTEIEYEKEDMSNIYYQSMVHF